MRPKKTPLSKSTTGGDKCALDAALREHCSVVVIEGYQTARSACAVGLTPVDVIEPQTTFKKEYRRGIREYQLLKQPRIGPSKGQQRGVAMVDAAADKRSHWFLSVGRVAKHTVKPRLPDSVICDCVAVVGELPRRVYWRARVEVEMTERPNQIGGGKPFVFACACASFKGDVHVSSAQYGG